MAVLTSIQSELQTVEIQMSKEIHSRSLNMEELIDLQLDDFQRLLSPAISLAVSRIAGPISKTMISMSCIFQYIFLAHYIHGPVKDGNITESDCQYPVLIGDFMFGQLFVKMCEKDLFPYVGLFATVIKTINEGIVLRWRFKHKKMTIKDYRIIIGKERASLTALAGRLSAEVSGIKDQYIPKFEEFGYNTGMAWAAAEESIYSFLVQEYLAKVKTNINELREYLSVTPLQELYDFFQMEISKNTVSVIPYTPSIRASAIR